MNSPHPTPPKRGPEFATSGREKLEPKTLLAPLYAIKPGRYCCRHFSESLPEVFERLSGNGGKAPL